MTIELPTAPQVRKASPVDARVFLGGQPKVGKTTLASQWKPDSTLLLDCEGGTRMLEGDHFVLAIRTWQDFIEAVKLISAGDHPYQTIVIDTIDALVKLCDSHVAAGRRAVSAGAVEYGKGLSELEALIRRDVGQLLSLGYGVWMLGHTELQEVNKVQRMVPSVDKKVRGYVLGACDYILLAEALGTKRVLHTTPSERFEAGSRHPMPEPLDMDPRGLYAAMDAGLKATASKPKKSKDKEPEMAVAGGGGE
jgi:hypothetical protein